MNVRTIGKLATELGIGVETIRFYERRGLRPQPVRTGGGYRRDGDDVAAMIRYIRLAQQLGLTLKDVERLKAYLDRGSSFCSVLRKTARNRLDAVTQQVLQLEELKAQLTAFLNRCEEREISARCPILVELGNMEAAVKTSFE